MFMKKIKSRWKSGLLFLLLFLMIFCMPTLNIKAAKVGEGVKSNPLSFRDLTVDEMVAEMGAGWNLGNTMDGHTGFTPSETLWQDVETTKELIKAVHDLGFNTIRVPVTWGTMIDDENGYAINETWMSRVQDIVDYCISQDIYVIINIHHDGAEQTGWLRVAADDIEPVYEKFEHVWRIIAERFKDYDEHLIFESMNEVTGGVDTTEGVIRDTKVIMNLNQIFVDVVRSTGSNNEKRWLSVPGRYTNIDKMTDPKIGFDLPKDTIENRIFASVHYYDYTFGMVETLGVTLFSYDSALKLAKSFEKLQERFTSKGIPVILGEYGAINKMNTIERAYHVEALTRFCQEFGIVACYWDQGWYDLSMEPDYSYTLVDRKTGKSIYPEITDAIMRGTYLPSKSEDYSDIVKDPEIIKIDQIILEEDNVILTLGENKKLTAKLTPEESNDLLLWKTQDERIATVFNGNIRARGIGKTNIIAFSQSGSIEKVIPVTVMAKESSTPATAIVIEKDSYELITGSHIFLNATIEPAGSDEFLTYHSSNEDIVTVSPLGKVVAKATGRAYITMTASNGLTKTVKITVKEEEKEIALNLAINVYYNDSNLNYFSNEVGENITVPGEGQYTLTFDVSKHLSDQAKAAGVTSLNNLTAVYIKDYDVTTHVTNKTPLESCNIMFDKIVVDGVELTINQTEPKTALKKNGVLDTNDPLNSWDGSVVDEVTVTNHVLNIVGIDQPQKIEVTFTLSDMVYKSTQAGDVIEATNIEALNQEISLKAGEEMDLLAVIAPANTTSKICFVSSDASIAYVNPSSVTVDAESGNASRTLRAMSEGTTTITAFTENGLTAVYQVLVEAAEVVEEVAEPEPDKKDDKGIVEKKDETDHEEAVKETIQVEEEKENKSTLLITLVATVIALILIGLVIFVLRKKAIK